MHEYGHGHGVPFFVPRSLKEALEIKAREGDGARVIAGGTDVIVWQTRQSVPLPKSYLSIWGLPELKGISAGASNIRIGALTTFSHILDSKLIHDCFPALQHASRWVGAAQIQNRGTLGGNVVNASPAGDSLPVLAVYDARLIVESAARGRREVAFADFYTGYRQTALAGDELLVAIELPILSQNTRSQFSKVGSRRAQTISKVMAAIRAELDSAGALRNVALSFGSVAPTPIRVPATERCLEGRLPSAALADEVADVLQGELNPIDDIRSTAEYRRFAAVGLLRRFLRSWAPTTTAT